MNTLQIVKAATGFGRLLDSDMISILNLWNFDEDAYSIEASFDTDRWLSDADALGIESTALEPLTSTITSNIRLLYPASPRAGTVELKQHNSLSVWQPVITDDIPPYLFLATAPFTQNVQLASVLAAQTCKIITRESHSAEQTLQILTDKIPTYQIELVQYKANKDTGLKHRLRTLINFIIQSYLITSAKAGYATKETNFGNLSVYPTTEFVLRYGEFVLQYGKEAEKIHLGTIYKENNTVKWNEVELSDLETPQLNTNLSGILTAISQIKLLNLQRLTIQLISSVPSDFTTMPIDKFNTEFNKSIGQYWRVTATGE